jgi:nucleotide-binding universal stress UspA family protein
MKDVRRILVPVDFSEHSERALEAAIGLAQKFAAELHLVHCYQPYAAVVTPAAPYDFAPPEGFDRAIREAAQRRLLEWCEKVSAKHLRVQDHLCVNVASEGIVELARKIGADLIVMGTQGLTGLKHVLLGSVAERTVRLAPCPVLTVKRGAAD